MRSCSKAHEVAGQPHEEGLHLETLAQADARQIVEDDQVDVGGVVELEGTVLAHRQYDIAIGLARQPIAATQAPGGTRSARRRRRQHRRPATDACATVMTGQTPPRSHRAVSSATAFLKTRKARIASAMRRRAGVAQLAARQSSSNCCLGCRGKRTHQKRWDRARSRPSGTRKRRRCQRAGRRTDCWLRACRPGAPSLRLVGRVAARSIKNAGRLLAVIDDRRLAQTCRAGGRTRLSHLNAPAAGPQPPPPRGRDQRPAVAGRRAARAHCPPTGSSRHAGVRPPRRD